MCEVSSLYVKMKWSYQAETTFPQTDISTDRHMGGMPSMQYTPLKIFGGEGDL